MIKKQSFIFSVLIIFSYPLFSAPYYINALQSTPIIDGVLNQGEWSEQEAVHLSRVFHEKRGIKLYYAHDDQFLYLAAKVQDQALWADGAGNGAGNPWESFDDDSIEWYFDLNQSKDNQLQADDRSLTLNIGNPTDSLTGNGVVARRSFNAGNGSGSATGILDPNTFKEINYKVQYQGTVNNDSDIDQGYSIEVAIPWSLLPNTAHADGDSIGINALIISDDTGGTRDLTDHRDISPPNLRFTTPIFNDEYVELISSEQHSSLSGLNGPAAYTTLRFQRNNDTSPPAAVENLTIAHPRAYSLRLQWNNSGDNQSNPKGTVKTFDVRYSTSPITNENFASAEQWHFNANKNIDFFATTNIRVTGLTPATNYFFAIRAIDEAGNQSPIVFSASQQTLSLAQFNSAIPDNLYQGLIAVSPNGRYFTKENGQPIIPIGTHYLQQDDAIRYLYNGDIWTGSECHNFTENPEASSKIANYMAKLKASGINVMRLFLEDLSLNVPGDFNQQGCAYWLESPRGNFNPKMADFIIKILQLSADNGIYVLINPFDTFFYDNHLPRTVWHPNHGGSLTDINQFFKDPNALQMAKDRWTWVIQTINQSGYGDVVFGYEVLNEWDSFEWTKAAGDANEDAKIRIEFIKKLVAHMRSIDSEHLILSSTTSLDSRGALAHAIYDSELFDAILPHLYLPANREPWNNPAQNIGTAIVQEQANALSWWVTNQRQSKPVLNGEWGPSDGFLPNSSNPSYFAGFNQADDELITRKLWFTELASGAAGAGIRMPGGVRGGAQFGLHLSDGMFSSAKTIAEFVKTGLDFNNFNSYLLQDDLFILGASNHIITTGISDKKQGIVYLHQDQNKSSGIINNATLNLANLDGGAAMQAEFWATDNNQTSPRAIIQSNQADLSRLNGQQFNIPAFNDDWMIKFYESYSTRLKTWRDAGQQVIALDYKNMQQAGAVDIYFVYIFNGELFSLVRDEQDNLNIVTDIVPFEVNIAPNNLTDEVIRLDISGTLAVDVFVATIEAGKPITELKFKTLQFSRLIF